MGLKHWLACFACAGAPPWAAADALQTWDLAAYNSLRMEHYGASGDLAASPYPWLGAEFYDEFGLEMRRRVSPYEAFQASLGGVANASDYRSSERGAVLERARLVWDKGDAPIPFRAEAGDFQANFSPRVMQRSLKGAQVELQPGPPGRHSLQFFSGVAKPIYRNLDEEREQASGFSWLLDDPLLGNLGLNAVRVDEGPRGTLAAYSQRAWSLDWNRSFRLPGQRIEAEVEWANTSGQQASGGGIQDGKGRGFFAQVEGKGERFDYRLRHNDYDYGFRPLGGAVTADQRASEIHAGWMAPMGVQLRARLLDYSDSRSTGNPISTRTAGFSLSGTAPGQWSTWLDAFQQRREDANRSVDARSRVISLALGKALSASLNLRANLQWNDSEDRLAGTGSISRQAQLTASQSFSLGPIWQGSIRPGVLFRHSTGPSEQTDWNPSLALALRGGRQSFHAAYSHYQQDAHFTGGMDSLVRQASLSWAWSGKEHRFELEANHYDRDPSPGATTSAYRVAATWTWHFDRPARPVEAARPRLASGGGLPRLEELQPGIDMATLRGRLRQAGVKGLPAAPGAEVYELALLSGVDLRQRLLLEHDGEHLARSVLVLDFPNGASPAEMAQAYQRVAEILYRQLGTPERRTEEGAFTTNLAADLIQGRFRRQIDWPLAAGSLRMGIPTRGIGRPRIEIITGSGRPDVGRWGSPLGD